MNNKYDFELTNSIPYLSQTFFSLEGEGMTVGRAALFLRINGCNATCKFCDTAFSIPGNPKYNLTDMVTENFEEYLINEYSDLNRNFVNSITITGGEPLKNILSFKKMFKILFDVFPNVSNVIFETNGTYLIPEKNVLAIMKQLNSFTKKISFTLSISPKLSAELSWHGVTDTDVLEWYKTIIHNYNSYLNKHFDIQLKFIHFEEGSYYNQLNTHLIDYCVEEGIPRFKILIMPLTPKDPTGVNAMVWSESKDKASRLALKHHFRYSPRIHIDRKLD